MSHHEVFHLDVRCLPKYAYIFKTGIQNENGLIFEIECSVEPVVGSGLTLPLLFTHTCTVQ